MRLLLILSLLFTAFAIPALATGKKAGNPCVPAGCSSQLCVERQQAKELVTTCEWRDIYGCYQQLGVCKLQDNGKCGWEETGELAACLENPTTYLRSFEQKTHPDKVLPWQR